MGLRIRLDDTTGAAASLPPPYMLLEIQRPVVSGGLEEAPAEWHAKVTDARSGDEVEAAWRAVEKEVAYAAKRVCHPRLTWTQESLEIHDSF